MTKITDLATARALKRIGAPLNTPVVKRTFSQEYSKHWFRLMKAHTAFMMAIKECSDAGRFSSGKWRLVKRRFKAFVDEANRCDDFFIKLWGSPPPAPPVFKSEQDKLEAAALYLFLAHRAVPYIEYWKGVIDAVEDGAELTIWPRDIPIWLDGND